MTKAPNALTKGSVGKALVTFTVPFLLANVLQSLYGAVDLFVVGQFCDAQAVAAVSTGTQVTQIVTSLVTGLTLGGTILVGNYTGMERWDKVKEAIGTTLTVFALVAVLLTALMLLFEAPLLTLLNTPAESFQATMDYVAICAWGNFFICGYNALSAVLRGYGDSVRPPVLCGGGLRGEHRAGRGVRGGVPFGGPGDRPGHGDCPGAEHGPGDRLSETAPLYL